jgi:hypothetical protein
VLGVDAEKAVVSAVRVEVCLGDVAGEVEGGVKGEGGVALGKDDAVAVVAVGILALEEPVIEEGDEVGHREGRADVPDMSPSSLLENVAPDAMPKFIRHGSRVSRE